MVTQLDTSTGEVAAGGGRVAVLDSAHVGDIQGALSAPCASTTLRPP
jgi:hypothetical protein